jgi:NADH:ubiquinone reductase (H+-translocating)
VNLSEYGTAGNLSGILGNRAYSLKVSSPGWLMYRLLYKMHLQTLHGTSKMALNTVANMITPRTEPRIKLH